MRLHFLSLAVPFTLLTSPALADPAPPPDPPSRAGSVAMIVGGSVLAGAGTGLSLYGIFVALFMPGGCDGTGNCHSNTPFAAGFIGGGLAGVAAGIPLIVWGALRIKASHTQSAWIGAPAPSGWQWRF
jgi:hypothetical protein